MDQLLDLTTAELNNLFLQESTKFLNLLNKDPDSPDLKLIKMKVKLLIEILDSRKDLTGLPDKAKLFPSTY